MSQDDVQILLPRLTAMNQTLLFYLPLNDILLLYI